MFQFLSVLKAGRDQHKKNFNNATVIRFSFCFSRGWNWFRVIIQAEYMLKLSAAATVQFNISGEPPKALKMIDVQSAGRYNCVGHRLNASYGAMLQKRC